MRGCNLLGLGRAEVVLSVGELRREIGVTLLPGGKQRWGEGAAD